MDVRSSYHKTDKMIALKGTGIEASTYGVGGMALGPDGRTLVITLPNARNNYGFGIRGPGGDVIVLDLDSLNLTTGKINPPVKATTGGDTTVKFPQTVTPPGTKTVSWLPAPTTSTAVSAPSRSRVTTPAKSPPQRSCPSRCRRPSTTSRLTA